MYVYKAISGSGDILEIPGSHFMRHCAPTEGHKKLINLRGNSLAYSKLTTLIFSLS